MNNTLEPIVTASEAIQLLNQPNVVLVDARGGADAFDRYSANHLQRALFADLEKDLSHRQEDAANGGRHPLPGPEKFGIFLGSVGIGPDDRILVYDDKAGANAAARFWWMMKAAGHEHVQVIDGGLAALIKTGATLSAGPGDPLPSKPPYPISKWLMATADLERVAAKRSDPEWRVIDVRESYRYRGESEPIDLVAGHIPGAINLPYLENLEENGHFRPVDELKRHFRKVLGERPGSKTIIHCGSGVTACHTLLAMERAGISGASLYVGSWSEWSRNELPTATVER